MTDELDKDRLKSIKISYDTWGKIKEDLATKHPKSALLIREKQKKVLGFTLRDASYYNEKTHTSVDLMCLDFFDRKRHLLFLLTYSDLLHENNKT